ncbi:MAG: hypothetical protein ACK4J0_01875 [Candidatus Anstonellaceae archaeon]
MENDKKIKKLVALYIFWFLVIAIIWLIGEYFLYGSLFFISVKIGDSLAPAAFVYAMFLAVAFAVAQFILSPRPIEQKVEISQSQEPKMQQTIDLEEISQTDQTPKPSLNQTKKSIKSKPKKKPKRKKK